MSREAYLRNTSYHNKVGWPFCRAFHVIVCLYILVHDDMLVHVGTR